MLQSLTERQVESVNGSPHYDGPAWRKMSKRQKMDRIIECYKAGAKDDAHVASVLRAVSKSAIGGFIHKNRQEFPKWLLTKRNKNQNKPGTSPRYRSTPEEARAPVPRERKKPFSFSPGKRTPPMIIPPDPVVMETIIEAKPSIEPIGTCLLALPGVRIDVCGAYTGDEKLKRCPMHLLTDI